MVAATSMPVSTLVPFLGFMQWYFYFGFSIVMHIHNFFFPQQEGSKGTVADVLRPGTEMVAAGYTMYVSATSSAFYPF